MLVLKKKKQQQSKLYKIILSYIVAMGDLPTLCDIVRNSGAYIACILII